MMIFIASGKRVELGWLRSRELRKCNSSSRNCYNKRPPNKINALRVVFFIMRVVLVVFVSFLVCVCLWSGSRKTRYNT